MGMLGIVGWLGFSFDLFLGLGFLHFEKFKSFCLRLDLDCTYMVSRNLVMFAPLGCLCEVVAQDRHDPSINLH
jgi:hypothetical protein